MAATITRPRVMDCLTALCSSGATRYTLLLAEGAAEAASRLRWRRAPSLLPLGVGLLIGILFGVCTRYDNRYHTDVPGDVSRDFFHVVWRHDDLPETRKAPARLRCVLSVQPATPNARKYVDAALDTYGTRCDEMLVFTTSESLLAEFFVHNHPQLNVGINFEGMNNNLEKTKIFLVESDADGPSDWSFLREVLRLVAIKDAAAAANSTTRSNSSAPPPLPWTVLLNERNFLAADNLRAFLASHADDGDVVPVMIGRLMEIHSPLTMLFAWTNWPSASLEAGVVLSSAALRRLVDGHSFCGMGAFAIAPRNAGRALMKCALANEFRIMDPIDEEGHHVFVPWNLRQFFAQPTTSMLDFFTRRGQPRGANGTAVAARLADCCSDRAISFAHLAHADLRVLHFAINRLRIFGA